MSSDKLIFLSPEDFLIYRPNMTSYSTSEIQEAINVSDEMIDALTNGLSSKVINFNLVEDRTTLDTTNELYRTDYEWDKLKIAFVSQTQYTMQMGNNWTQGSDSFSSGGINAAFQRPTNRDIYAPTLRELLRVARVYVLQSIGIDNSIKRNKNCSNIFDNYYTKEQSDTRFVKVLQEGATPGQVAIINTNKQVAFADANTIDFKIYKTDEILYKNGQYYKIYELPDVAWVSGSNKNVFSEQETISKINELITAFPDLNITLFYQGEVITLSSPINWDEFKKKTGTTDADFKVQYNNDNSVTATFLSDLVINGMYQVDGSTIDLNNNATFQNLSQTIETIRSNLQNAVNTNKTNIETNTTDIQNLKQDTQDNMVRLSGNQTIAGEKTFSGDILVPSTPANDNSAVSKNYVATNYVTLNGNDDVGGTKKFTSQTIFANNNTLVKVGKGGYQNTMTGIEFSNGGTLGVWNDASNQLQISTFVDGVRFNTKVSSTVEPSESSSLTTKNYVDNAINTKITQLGGDNIVTLNTAQTISGVKSFSTQPITVDPILDGQVANKKYVDSQVSNVNSTLTTTKNNLQNSINNNTSSINTLNNWSYAGDSCIGFYMDGQVTNISRWLQGGSTYKLQFYTNITWTKNFVNACCVGVTLRGYGESNTFTPVEVFVDTGNKLTFTMLSETNKGINGQSIRLFFMKNKYF